MKKRIRVVAVTVVLTAVLPAANAQQSDPPKQSLTAKLKHKYLERRAKFMTHVKDVSFAVGCKVLADTYLAYVAENGLNDEAMKEGLARAAKPGECDYYRRHPEAAAAIRRIAAEAANQK
jgi:hypothetical protein